MVPFIGDTSLNLQLAGPNRIAGWVLAAVCVLAAMVGLELIQWLPTFVWRYFVVFRAIAAGKQCVERLAHVAAQ